MVLTGTFGIANLVVPSGGPKCVGVLVDFSVNATQILDGSEIVQSGKIEYFQGCYIDNSLNNNPLSLQMSTTNQIITAKAKTQGYYQILIPNPPQITANTVTVNGLIIPVFFYNVPIQPAVWSVA